MTIEPTLRVNGRCIYECANQLEGYVDERTPERLAAFLMREGQAASDLADALDTATRTKAALVAAGRKLANCAYNISQRGAVSAREACFLREAQSEWDAALASAPACPFDAAELDMIAHGDFTGPELGAKVHLAITGREWKPEPSDRTSYITVDPSKGEQARPKP